MPESETERIQVQCACGAKLRVAASAVGRRAKCPKCGEKFTISAPVEGNGEQGGGDWLDDLAAEESHATAAAPLPGERREVAAPVRPCPNCSAPVTGDATVCAACGHNLKSARGRAGVAGDAVTAVAKVAGTFVLGCVLSAVGGIIGAIVWYLIAIYTGYEVGYVAWAIGLATGFGMAVGYRTSGALPGIIAAAIALGSIFVAKIFIFAAVIYGVTTGDTTDRTMQEAYVANHMAAADLSDRGIDPAEATDEDWDEAYTRSNAYERVENMSDSALEQEVERYQAQDEAEGVAAADEFSGEDTDEGFADDGGEAAGGALAVFFMMMFGLFDIIFVILAMGSAYKIGSSGLVSQSKD